MIEIAVLHAALPREVLESGGHIRVACSAGHYDRFKMLLNTKDDVGVLVLDLNLLGEAPLESVDELRKLCAPESVVVVYDFAKWRLLEDLRTADCQVVRAPVSVRDLRATMLHLIVREIAKKNDNKGSASTSTGSTPNALPPVRKYTDQQLVRLQMVRSSVNCECPNQVANLVISLAGFESYSKTCENRDADDAKMHNKLYRATGRARAIMEEVLKELCEYENIDPDNAPLQLELTRSR